MEPNLITEDAYLKLKCKSCTKYLSYFPILLSEDKKNICGRCVNLLPQESFAKNDIYETVAQFIQFPCQYKEEGCCDKAFPKDIPEHEIKCPFRIVKCPTRHFSSCDWEGARPTAVHHCQDKHFDLILKDGSFELDLSKSHQCENLLEYESTLLIISQKFYSINKLMEFTIHSLDFEFNVKEIPCRVCFKTCSRKVEIECSTSSFDEKKTLEIFLDSLSDRNENSAIVKGQVMLEKNISNEILAAEEKKNDELIALLKCSLCQKYVLPPIYEYEFPPASQKCIRCTNCRPQNLFLNIQSNNYQSQQLSSRSKQNPEKTDYKKSRNFILDNLGNKLDFPCENQPKGCTFKSKPTQLKNHQLFCPRGNHICPVSEFVACKWNGYGTEIGDHVEKAHSVMVLSSSLVTEQVSANSSLGNTAVGTSDVRPNNSFTQIDFSNFRFNQPAVTTSSKTSIFGSETNGTVVPENYQIKCYIIKFSNRFFRLNFAQIDKEYHWEVQLIGPFQFNESFMFELEIIDPNKEKHCSLTSKQYCVSLLKKSALFNCKNCFYHHNQIAKFISDGKITYKIKVYK